MSSHLRLCIFWVAALCCVWCPRGHAAARIEVDNPSDTALLPYQLQPVLTLGFGSDRRPVYDMLRIAQPRITPEDSILAVSVENSPYNVDEAASVMVRYLPGGNAVTQDPTYLTITDYTTFRQAGTGRLGVACAGFRSDSAFIARNYPGDNTFDFLYIASGADRTGNGAWEPAPYHLLTEDYDYDGTAEMFFYLSCGRDKEPRLLICVDPQRLAVEWSLPVASSIIRGQLVSCRDSITPGVMATTYGPDNRVSDSNFDDRFGYVFRVDRTGNLVFNHRVAPRFRSVWITNVPSDSTFVVFHPWALPGQPAQDSAKSHLSLVTASGTVLKTVVLEADLFSVCFLPRGADSTLQLLTVDMNGTVGIYTPDLNLIAESGESILVQCVGSILLPGQSEHSFIFTTRFGGRIYSPDFECLAALPGASTPFPASYDTTGHVTSLAMSVGNQAWVLRADEKPISQYLTVLFWRYRNWLVVALAAMSGLLLIAHVRRRRVLAELQRAKARHEAILSATPDLMIRLSRDGRFLDYQAGRQAELYVPGERFIGRRVSDVMPASFVTQTMPAITKVAETLQPLVVEYELEVDGRLQCYEARIVPSGADELLAVVRNISERKAHASALERQGRILQQVNDAIVVTDTSGFITDFNAGAERASGYTSAEAIGHHMSEFFTPDEWARLTAELLPRLQNGQSWEGEMQIISKWGTVIYAHWTTSVLRDQSGVPVSWVGCGVDITERILTEQALRESEAKYRGLTENSNIGILLYDAERILFANRRAAEIWETTVEHLESLSLADFLGKAVSPAVAQTLLERGRARLSGKSVPVQFEVTIRTRTGRPRTIQVEANSILHNGKLVNQSSVLDITDRRAAEEALRESEERFRNLFENTSLGIYRTTPDGHILAANPALLQMLGYASIDDLQKRNLQEEGFEPSYPRRQFIERIEGEGEVRGLESAWLTAGGATIFVRENAHAVRDNHGHVLYYDGMIEDITDHIRTIEALMESEEKYRSLAEHSNLGILLYDDKHVYFVNEQLAQMLETSIPELLALPICDSIAAIFGSDQVDKFITQIRARLTGQPINPRFEANIVTFKGRKKRLESLATPISLANKTVVQATWVDITDRHTAELALRESEERYRSLAEHSVQGILLLEENRIIFANNRFAEILETTVDYVQEKSLFDIIRETSKPDEIDHWLQLSRDLISGREVPRMAEIDVRSYRGEWRRVEVIVTDISLLGKKIVQATWLDITARHQAERALRESESKFRAVAESMSAAITIFGRDRLLYCNPASVRMTGFSLEELLQKNFWDIIHPDFREMVVERGRARVAGENVPGRYEVKIVTRTGEDRWVDYAAQTIEFAGQPAILGTAIDITERKAAEAALARLYTERYEQIKEIAGGVSHEIYNALFPATTTLWTLRERLQNAPVEAVDQPRNLRLIELAEQAVARAIRMTETVTKFSRLEADKRSDAVLIAEVVAEALEPFGPKIEELGIEVTVDIPANAAVSCNRAHLHSIFTNLIKNSVDALVEVSVRRLSILASCHNQGIRIQVRDSGPGVPPENCEKIFKAFFTTKPGAGTGLGLAVVKRLVEIYQGEITVSSSLDRGTTFSILFPITSWTKGATYSRTDESENSDR